MIDVHDDNAFLAMDLLAHGQARIGIPLRRCLPGANGDYGGVACAALLPGPARPSRSPQLTNDTSRSLAFSSGSRRWSRASAALS
jgi:hypothetical protein